MTQFECINTVKCKKVQGVRMSQVQSQQNSCIQGLSQRGTAFWLCSFSFQDKASAAQQYSHTETAVPATM